MTTYSHALTGVDANMSHPGTNTKGLIIPDTDLNSNACSPQASGVAGPFAVQSGSQLTMQQGGLMQCKGPDGALHMYKYDAERSTPAIPVLLFVGP